MKFIWLCSKSRYLTIFFFKLSVSQLFIESHSVEFVEPFALNGLSPEGPASPAACQVVMCSSQTSQLGQLSLTSVLLPGHSPLRFLKILPEPHVSGLLLPRILSFENTYRILSPNSSLLKDLILPLLLFSPIFLFL